MKISAKMTVVMSAAFAMVRTSKHDF